jgi:hypothetical protein
VVMRAVKNIERAANDDLARSDSKYSYEMDVSLGRSFEKHAL